jgi:predicted RNA-binding protein associated with RNAse of E/G family
MELADEATPRRRPGEHVVLRELWRGRVWYARPAIVVADDPDVRTFYVPPRVISLVPVGEDGSALRLYTDRWSLVREPRGETAFLSFAFPDVAYAVILGWFPDGAFVGYYLNVQEPLRPSAHGFDTIEHILDATITPDRSSWAWKDEDELAEAVDRGIFAPEEAVAFREWGERAIAHVLERRAPFDREWDDWRPDPSWIDPALPPDATEAS